MLRKVFALSLATFGTLAIAPTAQANAYPACPYDLSNSGMTDEQIIRFCEDWERERRTPREGNGYSWFDGVTYGYPLPSDRIPVEVP